MWTTRVFFCCFLVDRGLTLASHVQPVERALSFLDNSHPWPTTSGLYKFVLRRVIGSLANLRVVALGASLGSGIDQFVLHSRDVVRVDFVAL